MSWYCLVLRSSEEQIRNKASSKIARRLWKQAGHNVTTLGREGGDASDADVVFVAVPSGSISEALGKVSGRRQNRNRRVLANVGQVFYCFAPPGEL